MSEEKKDTRWKPGQSGNPAGRPKGAVGWKRRFEEMASEKHPTDAKGHTHLERMFCNLLQTATKGGRPSILKLRAQELVLGYVIGKPVQTVATVEMPPETKDELLASLRAIAEKAQDNGKLPV
jgi:hypothetical protein